MSRQSEVLATPANNAMEEAMAGAVAREGAAEPGAVYCFVPAHGESKVGAVQEPLSRTWSEDLGLSVLLADFDSQVSMWQPMSELRSLDAFTRGALVRREGHVEVLNAASAAVRDVGSWMECARRRYDVVAADLTPASEEVSLAVMRVATSIFIVTGSDRGSLDLAREKAAWIGSWGLGAVCGMLLRAIPGGMRPDLAEDFTGMPVCSLIDNTLQIKRLAAWLTLDREPQAVAG